MKYLMLSSVAIVVLNYNNPQATIECLDSLCHLDYPVFQPIVVDNGSADRSCDTIKDWCQNKSIRLVELNIQEAESSKAEPSAPVSKNTLILIQSGANLGYAGGNNIGIRYALERQFPYLWILNNDTKVEPGALIALFAQAESDPRIGLTGATLVYETRPDQIQSAGGG